MFGVNFSVNFCSVQELSDNRPKPFYSMSDNSFNGQNIMETL